MSTKLSINNSNLSLYCGDCLDVLPTLPDNSIDLIACDPPYGTTQNKWDIVIPFEPLWKNIKRILKPKGIAVFTAAQPFASQLIMSNPKWYKYDLIWAKTVGSGQLNINRQPLRLHEHILLFYNQFGTYNEQKTEGKPYSMIRKAEAFEGSYGKQKDHVVKNDGSRRATSVLTVSNPRVRGGHKTEKPVTLMEYLIKCYSNEGDTVLDFAMGHATTGEACVNLSRNFVGIEKTEEWYDRSLERLRKILKEGI